MTLRRLYKQNAANLGQALLNGQHKMSFIVNDLQGITGTLSLLGRHSGKGLQLRLLLEVTGLGTVEHKAAATFDEQGSPIDPGSSLGQVRIFQKGNHGAYRTLVIGPLRRPWRRTSKELPDLVEESAPEKSKSTSHLSNR